MIGAGQFEDALYDLLVVVGFNDGPVVPGKGSAIFLHLAQPGYTPTQGCPAAYSSKRATAAGARSRSEIRCFTGDLARLGSEAAIAFSTTECLFSDMNNNTSRREAAQGGA